MQELPVKIQIDVFSPFAYSLTGGAGGGGWRSGPGGKGVGPGGKEWAGADWVVVRYVSLLPRFFIRFLKRFYY